MKAEVTVINIYWNKGLSDFFFRAQSYELLEQIVQMDKDNLDAIEGYCGAANWDLDELEEFLYNASLAEACNKFGIDYEDEDEDYDDEEDDDEEDDDDEIEL